MYWQFVRCTFADEMNHELFNSFNGDIHHRNATDQIIESRTSAWFDDISTGDKAEGFDEIVICAFSKAVDDITAKQGSDPVSWEWGKLHRLVLVHPLSSVNILDKVFNLNRGPFPVGGSFHTVSPYSYENNAPFDADHGSSHRHIFDLGNWDNSLTVIPTGNSGIPASKHYCDQTDLYISMVSTIRIISRRKIIENALYHMSF
jgi:penicillin amidase